MVVWASVLGATQLPHGDVLVEGETEGGEWQVARTLCSFKGGKVPICSKQDLVLTPTDSNTIEVDVRSTPTPPPATASPFQLNSVEHLNPAQLHKVEELLQRWSSVFATSEDDFGRTSAVLHQIPTGTAPPSRERTSCSAASGNCNRSPI
uniref:Uncharacterized protein n=1 Tax=Knipowitschia caucasica TaxID=637954 RepID=A0AAV2JA43_KNICA